VDVGGVNTDNGDLVGDNGDVSSDNSDLVSDNTYFNYKVLLQIKMLRIILQDKGSLYTQTEINRLLDQLVSHVDLATVQIGGKLYPHFV